MSKWGLLHDEVRDIIVRREWNNLPNLKARLTGEKPFPITISLKAPKGNMAIQDLAHFQAFVKSWKLYTDQSSIRWEQRNYRSILQQSVPCSFTLSTISALFDFIGEEAITKSNHWKTMMSTFLEVEPALYTTLIKHLPTVERLDERTSQSLKLLVLQLTEGIGEGLYLRALPLTGIHSKLIETYMLLLTDILDVLHDGHVSSSGGLSAWLKCIDTPKGWLHVRPLCEETKRLIGGFSCLQLPLSELKENALPATNILIVENVQTGLSLPYLPDTIAIFGGGKNVAWTGASWLNDKNVGYWGDIDTWGLAILSDVRKNLPHVTPLMMDKETLELFQRFSTIEQGSVESRPVNLNDDEQALFYDLKSNPEAVTRLEQEFYSADYIREKLENWLEI